MGNPLDDVRAELRLADEADGEEVLRRLLAAQEKLRLLREHDAVDEAEAVTVATEIGTRLRDYQGRPDDEPSAPGTNSSDR